MEELLRLFYTIVMEVKRQLTKMVIGSVAVIKCCWLVNDMPYPVAEFMSYELIMPKLVSSIKFHSEYTDDFYLINEHDTIAVFNQGLVGPRWAIQPVLDCMQINIAT